MRFVRHSLTVLMATAPCSPAAPSAAVKREVVDTYAALAWSAYDAAALRADALHKAVVAFSEKPDGALLAKCKSAWTDARRAYAFTEPCRFYSGPIDDDDGPEPMINSWPVDEQFLEGPNGLINIARDYPEITAKLLEDINQRDGETHVAAGFHAIEYMLWGVDKRADGPGDRPVADFTTDSFARRRLSFLCAATELLARDLRYVASDWEPGKLGNYRAMFVEDPQISFPKILLGMSLLAGAEMAGERLAVALATRSQEEEQSCFSDTTHLDFQANAEGLAAFWTGKLMAEGFAPVTGKGVRDVAAATDEKLAARLDKCVASVLEKTKGLPVPFDRMLAAKDNSPSLVAGEELLAALEDLADLFRELGKAMDLEIPSEIPNRAEG